jgi:hypothetical protein
VKDFFFFLLVLTLLVIVKMAIGLNIGKPSCLGTAKDFVILRIVSSMTALYLIKSIQQDKAPETVTDKIFLDHC